MTDSLRPYGRRTRTAMTGRAVTTALLALAMLSPVVARAAMPDPQQDNVLAGVDKFAQGAKEANEVTLDKKMLGLAGGFMGKKDGNASAMMQKLDSVMVRNYEYAAPGQYSMDEVEQVRRRLDTGGWSH
ncbi:MAG TPA: DUF4252 domain-containing protein, partial [Acidobacteriaceae bacterium]